MYVIVCGSIYAKVRVWYACMCVCVVCVLLCVYMCVYVIRIRVYTCGNCIPPKYNALYRLAVNIVILE